MPPSSRRRRSTYSRRSELNVAPPRRTRLRLLGLARPKAIARAIEIVRVMEIARARVAAASIVATAGIVDARSIVDGPAPTAAVVRDVIATARERTEWPLPPKRWLG